MSTIHLPAPDEYGIRCVGARGGTVVRCPSAASALAVIRANAAGRTDLIEVREAAPCGRRQLPHDDRVRPRIAS